MLSHCDIVCISSIDWDFIWQGHQEVMTRLARAGNRVLFIENTGARAPRLRDLPRVRARWRNWRRGTQGIRQVERGLYVYAPLVLPLPYAWWARRINRWLMGLTLRPWMQAVGFKRPVAWVFLPTPLTLELLRDLDPSLTVYYCIDSFAASSSPAQRVARAERQLIRQADLVFVTSQALRAYCAQWSARVHDFPFGVNLELFDAQALRAGALPADLQALPRPRVGYIGGVHQWVDQGLLRVLAERQPQGSVVLVGPIQTDVAALKGLSNVHLLGPKPHEQLPGYIQGFDVCIIPYHLSEYTRHVYPTKLNEYFALGRPVVSTALPEVVAVARDAQDSVFIGGHHDEFAAHVRRCLEEGNGLAQQARRRVAERNSWAAKVEDMSRLIEECLAQQRLEQESRWIERLLFLSGRAVRRLSAAAAVVLLAYGTVFHTPVLWWAAGPLRIAQPPQPADAIVVLAGGVGESGRAGQGYEERVQYAVELYRRGLAPRLVFSSGYRYVFEEAQVMKALAVAAGVPASAITLEMESRNTYDNIRRTAALLRQAGARRALLVSSPYHMRRAMLVARAVASDLEYAPTPIPASGFYGNQRRVAWHHVRAIAHEYLGILYYWWRGYLQLVRGTAHG